MLHTALATEYALHVCRTQKGNHTTGTRKHKRHSGQSQQQKLSNGLFALGTAQLASLWSWNKLFSGRPSHSRASFVVVTRGLMIIFSIVSFADLVGLMVSTGPNEGVCSEHRLVIMLMVGLCCHTWNGVQVLQRSCDITAPQNFWGAYTAAPCVAH